VWEPWERGLGSAANWLNQESPNPGDIIRAIGASLTMVIENLSRAADTETVIAVAPP
jgi:hypothetical protein